ncbi:histone-lysine N-methyltransferase SETMAR [Plakobranchus ocellatus]|uniref:Histone-lysine N-methyltransferase SETMAR n=1 Tax=Plakobranchus ocellatus TaxID=259542 RepID=A0AAV3Y888_9GAST|nr:histone-lysine N-methyltransferase SETMAR [Plakobranchus ocellatus]
MIIRNGMAPNTGLMKSSAGKIRKWVKNHGIITKISMFHPAPCITLPRSPLKLKFTLPLLLNVIPVEIDAFLPARQQRIDTHSKEINVKIISTLDRLKEAIRRKRPGLLRRGVVIQHDNATPHSANLTQQWLQRYGWEILPHPAHSPNLAPSDFHLFGPLKRHLGGMAFETEDDLISELRNWFDNLDVDVFRVGINSLLSRWQKCIDLHEITLRFSGRVNFNLCVSNLSDQNSLSYAPFPVSFRTSLVDLI